MNKSIPKGLIPIALVCGAILSYLGLKAVEADWAHLQERRAITHFQPSEALILKSGVREDSSLAGNFYPDMLYSYTIQEGEIWGWRLSYEEEPRSKAYWQRRVKDYQEGSKTTVYINPGDPKDAVMERKWDGKFRAGAEVFLSSLFLFCGLILLGVSLWTAFQREPREESPASQN